MTTHSSGRAPAVRAAEFGRQAMDRMHMHPQPLICVNDVEASSRWYRRLLGCDSVHGAPHYERLVVFGKPNTGVGSALESAVERVLAALVAAGFAAGCCSGRAAMNPSPDNASRRTPGKSPRVA